MAVTVSKVVALILAVVYVVAAGVGARSWSMAATVAVGAAFVLCLIWFPEEMGRGGPWRRYNWLSPSPAWLVAAAGWFMLVGLPLLIWCLCVGK